MTMSPRTFGDPLSEVCTTTRPRTVGLGAVNVLALAEELAARDVTTRRVLVEPDKYYAPLIARAKHRRALPDDGPITFDPDGI